MENINETIIIQEEIEAPIKRSIRGRPKKLDKPEKRSIRGRPKKLEEDKKGYDKTYFQKYYQANLKAEVLCDHCDRYITKTNLCRHKKSPYCINYILKEQELNTES